MCWAYSGSMEHENAHPMESPAPLLLGLAVVAVLVLGGLFTTGVLWEAGGPATVSTTTHAAVHSQPQPAKQPG